MSDNVECVFITEEECKEINQKRYQKEEEEKTIQVGLTLLDAEGKPVQFNKRKVKFPV